MRRWAPFLACILAAAIAWAGNGNGVWSPVEEQSHSYAIAYIDSGNTAANTPTADTPELVASSWIAGDSSTDWSVSTGGRLTFAGPEPRPFRLVWNAGVNGNAAASGDRAQLTLAKDGVAIQGSLSDREMGAGGDHAAATATWVDGNVSAGSYFEAFISIDASAAGETLTADHGCLSAWGGR